MAESLPIRTTRRTVEFVGRGEQLAQLESLWRKGAASLVTCQGRRRIGKSRLLDRYRIRDNYTRFYLRFIAPYSAMIRGGAFKFASLDALPGWDAVLGLQFENLVLNNVASLVGALGLERSLVLSAAPYRKVVRTGDANRGGCQIDLLLQLRQAMYVVEVKRRARIDAGIVDEVREKIARLPNPRGLSVRPVLVYDGVLSPAANENGFFAAVFRAADLFLKR